MPSSMTHTYFGINTYKELPEKYQKKIKNKLEHYKLFCQGSDPYMFYNFRLGKKAKIINNIQTIMHHTKTRDFFIETIKYINCNKLNNNEEIMAYLYGNIAHYYLDCYAHPYINYKGGKYDRSNKKTAKYNAVHQKIEYIIDMYYIDKYENINHKKFKTYKNIFNIKNISPITLDLINKTIYKVYKINNSANLYLKSIKHMKKFFKYANYDPYGIKLTIYKIIDKITPWNIINLSELSYHNNIDLKYLNLDGKQWNLPWDKLSTTNETFPDIMNKAKKDTINTIIKVTNMLDNNNINIQELNKIFNNWSYSTGKDYHLALEPKYFEF